MKKILFSLLVAGLSLGFASCSSDDNDNTSIVGKWQQVASKGVPENSTWEEFPLFTEEYTADGKYIFVHNSGMTYTNSYVIDGDKILLYKSDDKEKKKPNEIRQITKQTANLLEYASIYDGSVSIYYRLERIN